MPKEPLRDFIRTAAHVPFLFTSLKHLVRPKVFVGVQFREMKSLSAMSPHLRPTSENSPWMVRTQNHYEFVTFCRFISSCRLPLVQSSKGHWKTLLVQVCLSLPQPNPKRAGSMLSENYRTEASVSPYVGIFFFFFFFQIPSLSFFLVMNGHVLARTAARIPYCPFFKW